jgi:transcriptional regulator with PAS, ATPase and Fis domain
LVEGAVKQLVRVTNHSWVKEFPGTITVCDSAGIILEMNAKAVKNFRQEGGRKLIGTNLFDCHPETARTKLKRLMKKQQINVYTTEKKGVRKLVCQAPWYKAGKYRGFVELSVVIQGEIPNLVRDP